MKLYDQLMLARDRIKEKNENDTADPLMTSDTMYRNHFADFCDSPQQMNDLLRLLNEAHFIFIIHIVESDTNKKIEGINGYVCADLYLLTKIRDKFYRDLEILYEGEFRKAKGAVTIIREMVTKAREFNNTPFGKTLNVAMMLQQFEHVVEEKNNEYHERWRTAKLNEIVPDLSSDSGDEVSLEEDEEGELSEEQELAKKRAVDSQLLEEAESMNRSGKWGDAVDRFGVEFLCRIHFRKFEFDQVRQLIRKKHIAREKDLRFVRDTLRMLEERAKTERTLAPYVNQIIETRRYAQLKLNQLYILKHGSFEP